MSCFMKEFPTDPCILQNLPASTFWNYETEEDRDWRHALARFYEKVKPRILQLINDEHSVLTKRQRQVLTLYYLQDLPQQQVAERMHLSQSTVSRHLFGTARNNKTVGGAIQKLRKLCCDRKAFPEIVSALEELEQMKARRYSQSGAQPETAAHGA